MEKIPPHATRVFHGVLFDVYQWEQKLYDGSTATFEKIRRIPSTEIIVVKDEKILISEQEQPGKPRFLSLLGGGMREGEPTDPLEHAKMELLEESGYVARSWRLLEKTNFPWEKLDWENYLYVATDLEQVQEPHPDAGEKIRLEWVSFDEFIEREVVWGPVTGLYKRVADPRVKEWLRQEIFPS